MSVLITGRVFQGLGAGGLDVLNEIILADITTLKERPLYLGVLSIPMAAGTASGPIIGGLLSKYTTWRWIGWINLPIAALGLVLVIGFMRLRRLDGTVKQQLGRMDWIGLMLFIIGGTLLTTPVAWAGSMFSWAAYQTILPLVLGVAVLGVLVWYESRPAHPMFPYRRLGSSTGIMTLMASFFHGIGLFSTVLYLPLFFQAVFLKDPLQSAVSVMPGTCITVPFGIFAAIAGDVLRKYRVMILISWIFTAVGTALLVLWYTESSLAVQASFQVILGIGQGSLFSLLIMPMQASVKIVDDQGLAAGLLVSFRLFGGFIGLSTCSTIFNSIFNRRIANLRPLPDTLAILNDPREATAFISSLRTAAVDSQVLLGLIEVYRGAFVALFYMLAGAAGLGFLTSIFIKDIILENEELGRQRIEHAERESENTP